MFIKNTIYVNRNPECTNKSDIKKSSRVIHQTCVNFFFSLNILLYFADYISFSMSLINLYRDKFDKLLLTGKPTLNFISILKTTDKRTVIIVSRVSNILVFYM